MIQYVLREMHPTEFKSVFKRIKKDFAFGEYPPYVVMYGHIRRGIQKGLLYCAEEIKAAYAFCAEEQGAGYVLLTLFAVYPDYRGSGVGSAFLGEIKKMFGNKKALIVEVERPEDAKDDVEKTIREKRIAFYRKAGFAKVPGVTYSIWDIPMHLMVCLLQTTEEKAFLEIENVMHEVYLSLMGERFIHKMKFALKRNSE